MRRHATGRDAGLSVRIALAAILLLVWFAAALAGLYALFRLAPGLWPYWAGMAGLLIVTAVVHYRSAGSLLSLDIGPEVSLPERRAARVHAMLDRLAALAEIPPPALVVLDARAPNSFAVGLRRRRSKVVVTNSLVETLSSRELEAVLAHEVTHIANRDAAVMTAASIPATVAAVMVGGEGTWWWVLTIFLWPLAAPLVIVGTLLTLTISRYREFAADRGAALLTGAPEQLMNALERLAGAQSRIPDDDLRRLSSVEELCIVPMTHDPVFPGLSFVADHPPLDQRLAALAEIAREMGKLD